MLTSFKYGTTKAGPHLLILGGIHGDEACGMIAGAWAAKEFDAGNLKLKRGRVTIIPICNPMAREHDKRFIDVNMNRVIRHHDDPDQIEHHYANALLPYLDNADAILDLHAYHSDDIPFVFFDDSISGNRDFALSLGVQYYIKNLGKLSEQNSDTATEEYANKKGKLGICLECGHMASDTSIEVAKDAILKSLKHFDLIDHEVDTTSSKNARIIEADKIFYKEQEGNLKPSVTHFAKVRQGEVLAAYDTGKMLKSPSDGYIFLPRDDQIIGHEWFYFGTEDTL